MKTLILTDNPQAVSLARELKLIYKDIYIYQSPDGPFTDIPRLDLKKQISEIVKQYNLVISIHCKQLFPAELIQKVRCVNVHPGFNPFNRGWYPQVFSIINGLKAGVTIHEIDEELDHGPIIVQREYKIMSWDTSGSAYENIMKIERELLIDNFSLIRNGSYHAFTPEEGNLNFKDDFERLNKLDLNTIGSFKDFLNYLRALTHGEYRNAYFIDENGQRVYVRVMLDPENASTDLDNNYL